MENVRYAQSGRLMDVVVLVDEQRERNPGLVAEMTGITAAAQTDGDEIRTLLFEFGFRVAQLRDVLATVDSTPMAQKDDHGGTAGPERP